MTFCFLWILGCTVQPTQLTSADWTLSNGWTRQPWEADYKPADGQVLRMENRFTIEPGIPTEGASLELSGLWWSASVEINSHDLGEFTGGIVPVTIPLQGTLKTGDNSISIVISPPSGLSTLITAGSLSSVSPKEKSVHLPSPPIIHFRPKNHIAESTIIMNEEGAHPWAMVSDDEDLDGYSVQFTLYQDGDHISDLGKAEVLNGLAQLPPSPWPYETWDISHPVFYTLKSELHSPTGSLVHSDYQRVSPRSFLYSSEGLRLNGRPLNILGARMVYRKVGEDWSTRMQKYQKGGINALELHGEWISHEWLNQSDEMGIPLILVPRCIGRSNLRKPGNYDNREQITTQQDHRLWRTLLNHPSRVFYALEGPVNKIPLWSPELLVDPHETPIAGHHIPSRILRLSNSPEGYSAACLPKNCSNAWLIETTIQLQSADVLWSNVAEQFESTVKEGALGGIIPTPNNQDFDKWQSVWKSISESLGIQQLNTGPFRSHTSVKLTGLRPFSTVKTAPPNSNILLHTADQNGNADISLWYEGTLTIKAEDKTHTLEVQSDQWKHFERIEAGQSINWQTID